MNEIDSQKISESLNLIKELENDIQLFINHKFSVDNEYYTDLMIAAIADRSLKISIGFRALLEIRNSQCAAIILRTQIDNLARLYGLQLCKGKEYDYYCTFIDPSKKFTGLKDNSEKNLRDNYLIDKLSEKYEKVRPLYDELCAYVHLSEKHLMACSTMKEKQDLIEFTITTSRYDQNLEKNSYVNIAQGFLNINMILLKELELYFIEIRRCSDPRNIKHII